MDKFNIKYDNCDGEIFGYPEDSIEEFINDVVDFIRDHQSDSSQIVITLDTM